MALALCSSFSVCSHTSTKQTKPEEKFNFYSFFTFKKPLLLMFSHFFPVLITGSVLLRHLLTRKITKPKEQLLWWQRTDNARKLVYHNHEADMSAFLAFFVPIIWFICLLKIKTQRDCGSFKWCRNQFKLISVCCRWSLLAAMLFATGVQMDQVSFLKCIFANVTNNAHA